MHPMFSFALFCTLIFGIVLLLQPGSEPWDPVLEPYVAFVEQERGLDFTGPVDVIRADVAAELSESNDRNSALTKDDLGYDPYAEATYLLGLTGPIDNYAEAFGDVREAGAAAYYDPSIATIVLPDAPMSPALELTIVHELTHALQDQHGLLGYSTSESWSSASLRTALIEGDASLIEDAWYRSLPVATQAQLEAAWANQPPAPDGFLSASFAAPYALGTPVVTTVIADGGYERLNTLMSQRSLGSDERLLDPLSDTTRPINDAASTMVDPDGNEWFDGWIGAFGWYRAIAPTAGPTAAIEALRGYDDDAFVTFESEGLICTRYDIWFSSGLDARQFVETIEPWGLETELVDYAQASVRFDVCEPVGDPLDQVSSLTTPLVVANWMAVVHQEESSNRIARCAAFAQAAEVGFVPATDVDWPALRAAAASARQACE